MQAVFEYLARRGLTPQNAANRIGRWQPRTFYKFLIDVDTIVRESWSPISSPFSFVANSQLSGGVHPCGSPMCRMRRADRLARFAVLYGDQVTIQNPVHEIGYFARNDFDWGRSLLVGSLFVLWHLKPVIDAGLVAITNPATRFCEQHMPDLVRSGKLKQIESELRRQFAAHAKIEPDSVPDAYSIDAPEYLLEHGGTVLHLSPEAGNGRNRRQGVSAGVKRTIINDLVGRIVNDILHQQVLGTYYDLQYVTDREADFLALGRVNDPALQTLNRALMEGIAHSVPTLEQLPLRDLLRIRRQEGEVFAVYRDKLAGLLRDATPKDRKRIRQAFEHTVLPALDSIDALVGNEQKRLKRSATTDLFCGLAAVSVCVFTGVLVPNVVQVISGLGGAHYLKESLRQFLDAKAKPEEQVRNEPYYFLWKAREHARRQTSRVKIVPRQPIRDDENDAGQ